MKALANHLHLAYYIDGDDWPQPGTYVYLCVPFKECLWEIQYEYED